MQSVSRMQRPFTGKAPMACRPVVARQPLQVCASAVAQPATIPVKSADGSDKGTAQLALRVAGDTAKAVVHRYMVMVRQNARRGTASTLTRSEVRGGGKKPYAQKGTGNARRGSNVSPLFPGGGVTFGPKPKDWSIRMNKKERRLALATALQSASADMVVVENFDSTAEDKKTKTLLATLQKVGVDPMVRKVLLILKAENTNVMLAGRNVEKLYINTADKIKVFDLLKADRIVVEHGALEFIQAFYGQQEKLATITEEAAAQ
eukprot:CAMPEP_0119113200 /NCGR_PEP_ID=MMETSP1180-20130426/43113_1 /TAXON_ID=3052 ORGANISM="Chlamydomonas cf sp, Strain CCMP681" /NCGR_SAMPLE_ID=MMETSP1180 /ASSEMBLY_ACC=CAM_ASM_000741 /LENGTH=261 /DNA_ID=CAMNT_0007101113 /DNA_START=18 /DNA_END=803 /DNA_ORIENTATION=-